MLQPNRIDKYVPGAPRIALAIGIISSALVILLISPVYESGLPGSAEVGPLVGQNISYGALMADTNLIGSDAGVSIEPSLLITDSALGPRANRIIAPGPILKTYNLPADQLAGDLTARIDKALGRN